MKPRHTGPTITRIRKRTKMSTDMRIPLHSVQVPVANVGLIESWMNKETLMRFQQVAARLDKESYDEEGLAAPKTGTALSAEDIRQLQTDGIVEEADGEPTMQVLPFTVEEERSGSLRRRFILWTKEDNEVQNADYQAIVDLHHVSWYLDAVEDEWAVKRDLRCGFFQVPLSEAAREKTKFRDGHGQTWRLTRLPMGHVCAPEVMHTLMRVLAGDPTACVAGKAFMGGKIHVFVDGVRFSGSKALCEEYQAFVDERAAQAGCTFKDSESYTGRTYDFCGVRYDHIANKVALTERMRVKCRESTWETYGALESAVARFIHASAILDIPLVTRYFTLKAVRRRLNQLARGVKDESDAVSLSGAALAELRKWQEALCANEPVAPRSGSRGAVTLYTDASIKGWGAVLFTAKNEMKVAGAPWHEGEKYEVNKMETKAVANAFAAFGSAIPDGVFVDLRVDNTSVEAAVNRQMTKSEGMAPVLQDAVDDAVRRRWKLRARYVNTRENPADPISRGGWTFQQKATTKWTNRKG